MRYSSGWSRRTRLALRRIFKAGRGSIFTDINSAQQRGGGRRAGLCAAPSSGRGSKATGELCGAAALGEGAERSAPLCAHFPRSQRLHRFRGVTYVNEGTAINSPLRGSSRWVQPNVVVLRLWATTDPSRSGEGADLGCSGLGRCSVIGFFFFFGACVCLLQLYYTFWPLFSKIIAVFLLSFCEPLPLFLCKASLTAVINLRLSNLLLLCEIYFFLPLTLHGIHLICFSSGCISSVQPENSVRHIHNPCPWIPYPCIGHG